jgi:hypothetical protein
MAELQLCQSQTHYRKQWFDQDDAPELPSFNGRVERKRVQEL